MTLAPIFRIRAPRPLYCVLVLVAVTAVAVILVSPAVPSPPTVIGNALRAAAILFMVAIPATTYLVEQTITALLCRDIECPISPPATVMGTGIRQLRR